MFCSKCVLAEMNSRGLGIVDGSVLLPGEADSLNHSSSSRSSFSEEISSHWRCAGRLNCELHRHLYRSIGCGQDSGQHHLRVSCVQSIDDAKRSLHVKEKVHPVFPIDLSSRVQGWLSQFFNTRSNKDASLKQDKVAPELQPGGFESFLLEYEINTGMGSLHSYIMQPFKSPGCLPFKPEDSNVDCMSAQALSEVAITEIVSAIPSTDTLRMVPYFDVLHNTSELSHHFTPGGSSSLYNPEKAKPTCSDQHVTPDQLGSVEALASWLSDRLPFGIAQWGTAPGTKGVANLWIELKEGEILLEDAHPPKRTVHVASVKIKNKAGDMLVEAHQEMGDGSIRLRNRPLSEKMRPGENVEEACFRGIFEELGSQLGAKNRVIIISESYRRREEERESLSYPGLLTSYVIHTVDATIEDLPDTGFYTVEDEVVGQGSIESSVHSHGSSWDGAAVGVKKHYWRWIPQPS